MEITPDPDQVAALVERIERAAAEHSPLIRDAMVSGYILGQFAGMFVSAAREHGPVCPGCELCVFLAEGLTVVAAHHILSPELAQHDIWGPRP